MSARRWAPWWVALLGGVSACSLMVGEADLASVQCMQEGVVGPPACKEGQACLAGRCQPCSAVEACGDNLDNDCNGKPDDGCSAAGSGGASGGGSAGKAGSEQGGSAGLDASPDQSVGGSSGQAGEGGGAGQGGVAGQGGEAGASGGASGGGAGGGAVGGAGGQPTVAALGEGCSSRPCQQGLFCGTVNPIKNVCSKACCTSEDCGDNNGFVCTGAFGGGVCALSVKPQGSLPGGAECLDDDNCRSGRCVSERCSDTCCTQDDCASGTSCAVRDDDTSIWECQVFGADHTGNAGTTCSNGSDCKSNLCFITCLGPCSNDDDCMFYCSYHSILGARACSLATQESPSLCGTSADCGGQLCAPDGNNLLHCP